MSFKLLSTKKHHLSHEITDKRVFENRRKIIKAAAGTVIASLIPAGVKAEIKKYADVPVGGDG